MQTRTIIQSMNPAALLVWVVPLAALALLALGGCSTAPRLAPIERQTPVSIVIVRTPPSAATTSVRDTALARHTTTGTRIGAATGAIAGLFCGPLAAVCVPAGFSTGGTAGLIAGGATGIATSLPHDTVAQLNDRLERLQQSLDPLAELHADVVEKAGTQWDLTNDDPAQVVTVELQDLTLTSTRHDKIALVMQVTVRTASGNSSDGSRYATQKQFQFVSGDSDVANWLDERGGLPEYDLRTACQRIATDVVAELAAR